MRQEARLGPAWLDGDECADAALGAREIDALRLRVWHARIPQRFHRAGLDDLDGQAGDAIREWAIEPAGRNLVIVGPVGVGKTHAAIAAARPAAMRGLEVRFAPVVDLLDQLRPGGVGPPLIDALADVDRLILDDLGSERPTEWTAERMYSVINRRWMEARPTVATSNLAPELLAEAVGERTFSRLIGDGALVVRLAGNDRRRTRR